MVLMCIVCDALAQDTIVLKNNKTIEVKIIEMKKDRILYKEFNVPRSEIKRVRKQDVYQIRFKADSAELKSLMKDSTYEIRIETFRPFECEDVQYCEYKDGRLYYNDKVLQKKEFYYAMRECCPGTFNMYKSGSRMYNTGVTLFSVGSGFLYMGGIFLLVSRFSNVDNDYEDEDCSGLNDNELRNVGIGAVVSGASMLGVGIPLWVCGHKKKKQAFETFDKQCGSKSRYADEARIELGTSKYGLGLKLTF